MSKKLGILDETTMFIHGIELDLETMVFHFQEKREHSDSVIVTRSMSILIDSEEKEELFLRLQELAQYIIDMGYVELRNPQSPNE